MCVGKHVASSIVRAKFLTHHPQTNILHSFFLDVADNRVYIGCIQN